MRPRQLTGRKGMLPVMISAIESSVAPVEALVAEAFALGLVPPMRKRAAAIRMGQQVEIPVIEPKKYSTKTMEVLGRRRVTTVTLGGHGGPSFIEGRKMKPALARYLLILGSKS